MEIRGLATIFTRERYLARYRSGILITTSTPEVVKAVAEHVRARFPQLALTLLMPQSFCSGSSDAEIVTFEEVKQSPLRGVMRLRRRRFDVAIVIFSRDRCFRRSRLAAFALNARRVIIYNESCDSFVLDRQHWKAFSDHLVGTWRAPSLFIPFGLMYLLVRTCWLLGKARFTGAHRLNPTPQNNPKVSGA